MLLVNQQELPLNISDKQNPMYGYVKEYQAQLARLKEEFPKQEIKLKRIGWPKTNNGFLEQTPVMVIPLSATVESETGTATWAYCKGRPIIHANGLRDLPEGDKAMTVTEQIVVDLRKQPDLAVYLWFKSPLVKRNFIIDDPDRDAYKKAMERKHQIDLGEAVWKGLADVNRLRMVAAGWGVARAAELEENVLRDTLEKRILVLEKEKLQHADDLTRRGITEFLADIKADGDLRIRAVLQMAIESGKLKYNMASGKYFVDNRFLILIPTTHIDRHVDYMAGYYAHHSNREAFVDLLKEIATAEFVDDMDKKGIEWLTGLLNIDTKDKAASALKEEIKGVLGK